MTVKDPKAKTLNLKLRRQIKPKKKDGEKPKINKEKNGSVEDTKPKN